MGRGQNNGHNLAAWRQSSVTHQRLQFLSAQPIDARLEKTSVYLVRFQTSPELRGAFESGAQAA